MARRCRWRCVWYRYRSARSDVHVLPIQDLREHAETRDCWCQPRTTREGIGDAVVVVHHALDGRELVEQHGVN